METESQIPTHMIMTTTAAAKSSSSITTSEQPSSPSSSSNVTHRLISASVRDNVEDKLALLHDDEYEYEFIDKDNNEIEKFGSLRSDVKKEEYTGSDINKNDTNLKILINSKSEYVKKQPKREHASPKVEQGSSSQTTANDNSSTVAKKSKKSVSICLTSTQKKLQPIKISTNGKLPKSGKPMMSDMNKKLKPRGRPKRKALVAMYQSEISANQMGIKLCIKKSDTQPKTKVAAKANRKRSRKPKQKRVHDSEDSDFEKRRKKESTLSKKNSSIADKVIEEQTCWGNKIPENILYKIFQNVVNDEGCLPALIRLGKTCALWNRISLSPSLWSTMDLGQWTKERFKTELKLKWLIENRLSGCTDVNMTNWKITNTQCVLDLLEENSPNLVSITLAGWKSLTSDNLLFIAQKFKKLRRLDLSSINVEINSSKSAVGQQSLCQAVQSIGDRLTHLYLAHNRLAGIPQIVTTLATHCPNLILLDLSNVRTIAVSHGILHIEKLQLGCQKLKVLRITNSHVTLSSATLQEQMDSLGFPDLEELSVAALADESRLINDECLQRILKSSTRLNLLDVRGCARLTHDSLIRLPTWDLKHLFLSGCSVLKDVGSGLELIASKWAHSLTEFDLAWANVQQPLDNALKALAEKGAESPLGHLNLCGSSVSLEAVKEILEKCPALNSINLSSCRGLPRGVKRLLQGATEISELRENLGVTLKTIK